MAQTPDAKVIYLVRTGDLDDFGVVSGIMKKGDSIYAVAKDDDLLCLDLATGKVRWHFASSFDRQHTAWENSPAVDGDPILFDGHDGFVYALSAASGKLIWKTNLHAPVLTSPVIVGYSIYVGTSSKFYRLRATDAKSVASFTVPIKPWRNVTFSGNRLLIISSDLFYDKVPGELLSLHLASQHLKWQTKPPASSTLYPVWPYVWHGEVLASDNGHLYAYRETDGSLAWSHDFPAWHDLRLHSTASEERTLRTRVHLLCVVSIAINFSSFHTSNTSTCKASSRPKNHQKRG